MYNGIIPHASNPFQVMVATVRCEEIVNERYSDFTQNQVQYLQIFYLFVIFCYWSLFSCFSSYFFWPIAILFAGLASAGGGLTIWPCCWVWKEAQFNYWGLLISVSLLLKFFQILLASLLHLWKGIFLLIFFNPTVYFRSSLFLTGSFLLRSSLWVPVGRSVSCYYIM